MKFVEDKGYRVRVNDGTNSFFFPKTHRGLEEAIELAYDKGVDVTFNEEVVWSFDDEDSFRDGFLGVEDDAEALASAGFGTDEDYGCFGGDDF